ncbi:S1C family serine protease [Symbiobacterium thermophilum]|uniref:Serine proteinase n=2 Tax=Symbiobacterium thermophilum TaxID=2734 RepID=Q67SE1_SYMTH|nr:trypsin-like peptidase domain-containing protein [Symbiobacterium thermophilum]BAD39402.1 serine proteinase [Symbiobacterium thermophilum IAM 14863]
MYDDKFNDPFGRRPEGNPEEPVDQDRTAASEQPARAEEPMTPVEPVAGGASAEQAESRPELELPEIPETPAVTASPPVLYDPPRFEPRPKEKKGGWGRGWRLAAGAVALVVLSAAVGSGSTYYLLKEHLASQPANYQQPAAPGGSGALQPVAQTVAEVGASVIPEIYNRVAPAVVSVYVESYRGFYRSSGTGSGFVVDPAGYILTNYHVVDGAQRITVQFIDGETMTARVVGKDSTSDLAVLKVDPGDRQLVAATLGDSDRVQVGELAIAIGNPYGHAFTVTAGIVSAIGREIVEPTTSIPGAIQTDAAINPGNSGGPLLNSRGEVIGVNTAIEAPSQWSGNVGLGFAVPINTAKEILPTLMAGQTVQRPYLGVYLEDVDQWYARVLGLRTAEGAVVTQVVPGSAAEEAGLRSPQYDRANRLISADVIVALDGEKVTNADDLVKRIQQRKVGDQVELTVARDGQELKVKATLGARPTDQ